MTRISAVRSVVHLVAVLCVAAWGFLRWPLPWPGLLLGLGLLVLSVLLWALFLSPRPVLGVDRFAVALFELLLIAAAVAALLDLGMSGWFAVPFGVVGAVLGFVSSRRG